MENIRHEKGSQTLGTEETGAQWRSNREGWEGRTKPTRQSLHEKTSGILLLYMLVEMLNALKF